MTLKKLALSASLFVILFISAVSVRSVSAQSPSLLFEPSTLTVDTNEVFEVNIVVDTAGEEVGGVGAIIHYDPQYLQVVQPSDTHTGVAKGNLFDYYPKASFDNTKGEIYISGVVSNINTLFSGKGVLGSAAFMAMQSGSTTVVYDFTPGSTKDSNIAVTHGSGDVLSQVSELNVDITSTIATTTIASTPPASSAGTTDYDPGLIARLLRFFKRVVGINEDPQIDPYGTIANLPTNTDPNRTQPTSSQSGFRTSNLLLVGIVIVVTILIIVLVKIILSKRKPNGPTIIQKDIDL